MAHILVVEDDQLIGQIICDMLIGEGYTVDWQHHGGNAAQSIKDNTYHIVILDSNLPKISGLELLKLIRIQSKEHPVIILTAQSSYQHQQTYMEAGASVYLTKPFDFDELLEIIESLIVTY